MEAEMVRWHLYLKLEEKMHWSYLLLSENPRQAEVDSLISLLGARSLALSNTFSRSWLWQILFRL